VENGNAVLSLKPQSYKYDYTFFLPYIFVHKIMWESEFLETQLSELSFVGCWMIEFDDCLSYPHQMHG